MGGLISIHLSKGFAATIDEADAEWVCRHKWYAHIGSAERPYARRLDMATGKTVHLHRAIIGAPDGLWADHINGDTLDNRRCNLRVVTATQNRWNSRPHGKSGFKGVLLLRGRWLASIRDNGVSIHLGCFGNPEDAARAVDAAALRMRGEFARLNFPSRSILSEIAHARLP